MKNKNSTIKNIVILLLAAAVLFLIIKSRPKPITELTEKNTPPPPLSFENLPATSSPTEIIESDEIDENGWKIYKNDQYGFEIKYPIEWKRKIEEFSDERAFIIFSPYINDFIVGISITREPLNSKLTREITDNIKKQEQLKINGINITKLTNSNPHDEYEYYSYVFFHNEFSYVIRGSNRNNYDKQLTKIINNFKFTK